MIIDPPWMRSWLEKLPEQKFPCAASVSASVDSVLANNATHIGGINRIAYIHGNDPNAVIELHLEALLLVPNSLAPLIQILTFLTFAR